MNEKAYRVLEYDKIKELLRGEAASSMTQKVIDELLPSVDEYEIREKMAETTEAVSVIMHKGALPLGGFYDISGWVNLAQKGGVLTMKQLLEVLYNLQAARHAATFLKSDLPALRKIDQLAALISIQKDLESEIDRCILSEDEMADSASPELKSIRRKIGLQNEAIRNKMSSILTSSDNKSLLQDSIVTMRQGRYVIPVKQEHKGRFPGIVHDQSATGATLFIEPQAIVNLNNELRELELAEKKEVYRILAQLSAAVGQAGEEIKNNQRILIELDFMFAKGKLSAKMKAEPPEINTDGILYIREGRHPLIDPKKVVPISVSLGKDFDTLVITGPNTGGKTVTLKTVGLFVLMAHSGLHLPAAPGTIIPLLRKVYADIGDEQSIEQSLSTFSSHMRNIVDIVRDADGDTLVLLDELGAGTDPTEGAALAISILNELYGRGAKTLATTHYTELKKYAIATPGVQNASMEFDVETLSPTYHLTIGTPGRSNAFEISAKLGLPDHLIDHAKGLLDRGDIAFEDVITSIEKDRKLAEQERDEAMFLRIEMKRQKEELEKQQQKFAEQKEKLLAKAKEEARDIVQETKELADLIQSELRELEKYNDPSQWNRKQEALRREIRELQDKHREKIEVKQNLKPVRPDELNIGDAVRILSLDQKGELISLPDEKNEVQVQIGLMKINVGLEQISRIQNGKKDKKKQNTRHSSMYQSKVISVMPTCNVVGKVLDDALMDVDKYLDDAFMAGLKEVTIIHGRGAGILREGLTSMFKTHKHVEKYRKGNYNEGGDGVTIVTLK
ncbi:MAG: endonuclease MutS2 [Clostridiales bacterium]|nr:endonuclease MutS2 [Clostridiales bacterium]